MSDKEVWEPLAMVDYIMLGFVGTVQTFALGVCIHLLSWRHWPPYVTKNVDIVIVMVGGQRSVDILGKAVTVLKGRTADSHSFGRQTAHKVEKVNICPKKGRSRFVCHKQRSYIPFRLLLGPFAPFPLPSSNPPRLPPPLALFVLLPSSIPLAAFLQTFAGFAWTIAGALENGLIRRSEGDLLAKCYLERFLAWSALCTHIFAFFIRVYRMWRILVKHDDSMWPAKFLSVTFALDKVDLSRSTSPVLTTPVRYQIMLLSSISLVPPLVALLVPGAYVFDETVNSCNTTSTSRNVVLAMNVVGFYTMCYLWFVCTRQLRWVRKQFNEYETMKWTLSCLTLLLFSYVVVVVVVLDNQHVYVRRVAIVYPALTTHAVLWGSIGEPVMKKWTGDDEYLWSFTKGFSEMPSPAQ
ncbi:unnamed protein product [Ectocarpus sp. CCAP 1310/34]|nr:unnamed protein product [Ectocarpus sp. CCAP 1310/34]